MEESSGREQGDIPQCALCRLQQKLCTPNCGFFPGFPTDESKKLLPSCELKEKVRVAQPVPKAALPFVKGKIRRSSTSEYTVHEEVKDTRFLSADEVTSMVVGPRKPKYTLSIKSVANNIGSRIARDACSQKISTNVVLPEHIFRLKAGDKVPADGIFISWSSKVKNNLERPNSLANCNGAAATVATSEAGSSSSGGITSEDLPTTSSLNSNDLIRVLVANLESPSIEDKKQAARLIRILTKDNPENQVKMAKAGAIKSLISLLFSSDTELQEDGVTSILSLLLCEENKELKLSPKAIKPLIGVLDEGTLRAQVKAASILLLLSQREDDHYCKTSMGWLGAIPLLVRLLEGRCTIPGKMKAAKALQSLCSVQENKRKAFKAGIMRPLVKFMVNLDIDMAEVSVDVLSVLVSLPVAIEALVEEQGIPALVKMIEKGWRNLKEISVVILLRICEDNEACCAMVANQRESVIRGLENRSQFNSRTKQKAETLIELIIRNPRFENTTA